MAHLCILLEVKRTVWKRCRLHDGSHDLDTSAHDWNGVRSGSAARWSRISSTISCGTLGMVIASVFTEAGRFVFDVFGPIQGVGRGRNG